jgi:hypothetical protein
MRFFDFRSRKLDDHELRDTLFNAVAESKPTALKKLLTSHRERVVALFPTWTKLPPFVRSEPARTKWWAEGMIGVASAAAELGEASLMAQLQGPPEENILIQWQDAFVAAEADAAAGEYNAGISRLEQMLEKARRVTGPAVDELLPKTYGLLGTLNYQAGNRDQAHELTLKAKAYCDRLGDHEGAEIYARNLKIIDAV